MKNEQIIEDCVQDLMMLFKLDLNNKYEKKKNKIFLTMQNGQMAKIEIINKG